MYKSKDNSRFIKYSGRAGPFKNGVGIPKKSNHQAFAG
jgi:hypothetical protein